MKIQLSDTEKEQLESLHSRSKEVLQRDRLRAILLASEGWTGSQISQALRLHVDTVYRYLKDYSQHRKVSDSRGGSSCFLTPVEAELLDEHLSETVYMEAADIVQYVKAAFGVDYSLSGMTKWLKARGYRYKQPNATPAKRPSASVQEGFIERYEALKAAGHQIAFMDSAHPTQASKLACGWIMRGKKQSLDTTGSRSRINVCGAINLESLGNPLVEEYDTINQESIVDFLQKLRDSEGYDNDRSIYLILDQAGYHKTTSVLEAAEALNIELVFLPPYSPNLNPIERLWKIMNKHARNNRFFETKHTFKSAILSFFKDKIPTIIDELESWITDNFQVV
jgi:transposase